MKKDILLFFTFFLGLILVGNVNAAYIENLNSGIQDQESYSVDIATYIESFLNEDGTQAYYLGDEGLTYLTKIGVDDGTSFEGFSIDGESSSGQWFAPEGTDVDFVIVKAGSDNPNSNSGGGFSIFLADDNFWDTAELKNKDISHISFWSAKSYNPPGRPPDGGAQVPEPATIFLLGSGLLGLFGYRKKFWKPKN